MYGYMFCSFFGQLVALPVFTQPLRDRILCIKNWFHRSKVYNYVPHCCICHIYNLEAICVYVYDVPNVYQRDKNCEAANESTLSSSLIMLLCHFPLAFFKLRLMNCCDFSHYKILSISAYEILQRVLLSATWFYSNNCNNLCTSSSFFTTLDSTEIAYESTQ